MTQSPEKTTPRNSKLRRIRYVTAAAVLVTYVLGIALNTGLGSLSGFGVEGFSLVCPIGALETAIAGRIVLPIPFIALVAAIFGALFVGRAFCSWICPVPLVRKLATNKEERDHMKKDREKRLAERPQTPSSHADCASEEKAPGRLFGKNEISGLGVLAAVLITTVVFGFPVFCLACPIGLVFGTLSALVRLFVHNELVVDILVFPAILMLELIVLRKWCASLCPVGAFLGLVARLNRTFLPTVDRKKCLALSREAHCTACHDACNFDIDLVRITGSGVVHDCSRCGECAAACPTDSITFPLKRPDSAESD